MRRADGTGPRQIGLRQIGLRQIGLRRIGLALIVVRGRSMAPTLADGDLLLVRWRAPGRAGRVALVRLPGDRPIAVKRLTRREPGGWWLERDNPAEGVDSWHLGPIVDDAVLGLVLARLWPRPRRL